VLGTLLLRNFVIRNVVIRNFVIRNFVIRNFVIRNFVPAPWGETRLRRRGWGTEFILYVNYNPFTCLSNIQQYHFQGVLILKGGKA
jgi:hypothetical protein